MIIGILGRIKHGKDTVQDIIKKHIENSDRVKFADTLKDMICVLLKCTRSQLEDQEFKQSKLPNLFNKTPRELMQSLGTDWGRKLVHTDIWVQTTLSNLTNDTVWIISDTRFPNEVKAIRDKGGIVIKVVRNISIPENEHESETQIDQCEFDYLIENFGTLEDLEGKVLELLKDLKLINTENKNK